MNTVFFQLRERETYGEHIEKLDNERRQVLYIEVFEIANLTIHGIFEQPRYNT